VAGGGGGSHALNPLGWFKRPANLLREDLVCEVVIHIRPDGATRMYVSKIDAGPKMVADLAQIIIRSGLDFARQHGVHIKGEISNG
jgi:hypothetical protein